MCLFLTFVHWISLNLQIHSSKVSEKFSSVAPSQQSKTSASFKLYMPPCTVCFEYEAICNLPQRSSGEPMLSSEYLCALCLDDLLSIIPITPNTFYCAHIGFKMRRLKTKISLTWQARVAKSFKVSAQVIVSPPMLIFSLVGCAQTFVFLHLHWANTIGWGYQVYDTLGRQKAWSEVHKRNTHSNVRTERLQCRCHGTCKQRILTRAA